MLSNRLGLFLLTSATLIQFYATSARAASLEAFAGAVAGYSSCTTFVTPAPIANFFGGGQAFKVGTTGNGISDCSLQGGTQDVTQAAGPLTSPTESLSNVSPPQFLGGTFTGQANGTANYGIIGASANGQFSGTSEPLVFTEAASFGLFDDMLTITSPNHAAGSMGTAQFTFTISGSLSTNTNSIFSSLVDALAKADIAGTPENIFHAQVLPGSATLLACSGNTAGLTVQAGSVSGSATCSNAGIVTFAYGVPFEIKAGLLVQATPATSGNATGNMTAALTGITVSGESNFSVTGASGAPYPVPEPSTALLLSSCITGLAVRYRRTRGALGG